MEPQRPTGSGPEPQRISPRSDSPGRTGAAADSERRGTVSYGAPPPPPPGANPPPGGRGRKVIPLVVVAALVIGGLTWLALPTDQGAPSTPPVATVQAQQSLRLSAADANLPATRLAQRLIAAGGLPAAPATPPVGGSSAPGDAPPAGPTPGQQDSVAMPTAAPSPFSIAQAPAPDVATPPAVPKPAPVIKRVKHAPAPPAPAPDAEPDAATAEAVQSLVEKAPEATRQDLASGRQVIYTLHVLDNLAEDADQVEVMVDGVSFGTVTLTNLGQDVLIPLKPGAQAQVRAVARFDGGGGVTFGASSSLGEVRSRIMAVGESDDWTVIAQ